MPEGDTIRRLATEIHQRHVGRTVTASTFRHPRRLATLDLTGRTLTAAESHGKHLFLHWDDERSIHVHLLMQGRVRFQLDEHLDQWRRRFEIRFDNGPIVGVDIPLLHLVPTDRTGSLIEHLGPDLCGDLDLDLSLARLSSALETPLGGALLDQRNIAGFGNIYAVEVPFICGVSPLRPVGEIEGLDHLVAVGAALIRTNARLGPQNTTGRHLNRNEHWILERRTTRCPRCGSGIRRLSSAESRWNRLSAWCPTCQHTDHGGVEVARVERLLSLHPARRLLDFTTGLRFIGPTAPVEPSQPARSGGRRR